MKNCLWFLSLLVIFGCSPEAAKQGALGYRTVTIKRGNIVRTVESTGSITPRNSLSGIPVGAQVTGKILKLYADYNSVVTNGQIVAIIDPQVYSANYKSAVAQLAVDEATVVQRRSALVLTEKTLKRKEALYKKKMCSDSEYDIAVDSRDSARAQLESAIAQVERSKASVSQAKANLDYCTIRSPVNGIVISRNVEEGETVVSSMNAVSILTIAEDLKVIWVAATVPEADVGNIQVGQSVSFTVDAYRRKFIGKVKQIRRAATTTNNVVTFPVIIEAENPNEMLFPGMTATLSIETAMVKNVLTVGSAAFRFRPKDEELVGLEVPAGRKLWVLGEDGKPRPVKAEEGVSDNRVTEIISEDRTIEGREAIIGYQVKSVKVEAEGESNPFMPKMNFHNKNKGTAPEPKK